MRCKKEFYLNVLCTITEDFYLPLGIVMDKKIQEINYYTNNIKLITMVNFSLEGKVALVTGASYGIGFAIASAFAAAGATIVFNDIKQELVDKGLAAYQEKGIKAFGYVCDVTSEEQVNALVAQVEKEVGVIDILVNNAGIIKRIPDVRHECGRIPSGYRR